MAVRRSISQRLQEQVEGVTEDVPEIENGGPPTHSSSYFI